MKIVHLGAIFGIMILLSGCGNLFFNAKALTPKQKQEVYQNVQDEVAYYKERGDFNYALNNYAQALHDYEMVNFYEDEQIIPSAKIQNIRLKVQQLGRQHYNTGLKLVKSDPKEALADFNFVMQYFPQYKDAKMQFALLKIEPNNTQMLQKLENSLRRQLRQDLRNPKVLKNLNHVYQELYHYDAQNHIVKYTQELLKEQRIKMLEEAFEDFKRGNYARSKEKCRKILEIYPNDVSATKYLQRIQNEESLQVKIQRARQAMKEQMYDDALQYASQALEYDSQSKDAQNIYDNALKKYQQKIPTLIAEAIKLYNQQSLKESLAIFESIVKIDPDNDISRFYMKKIEQQLQTINNLK